MTLLAWLFLALFLLTHVCGVIFVYDTLYEELCDKVRRMNTEECISVLNGEYPCRKEMAIMFLKSFFWELMSVCFVLWIILLTIARSRYWKLFLNFEEREECSCDFQPMSDGTGLVCDHCGYFIDDALLEGETDWHMDYYNKKYPHRRITKEWKKFRKTIWYRILLIEGDVE